MVKIKICGVTSPADAKLCADLGVEYVGVIFVPQGARRVTPLIAKRIVKALPKSVTAVGVFMDQPLEEVRKTSESAGIKMVQLHGKETPEYVEALPMRVIKVFDTFSRRALSRLGHYDVFAFLLDVPKFDRGPEEIDRRFARDAKRYGKVFLAGKLDVESAQEMVAEIQPYGVDVCGATESRTGKKDAARTRAFVTAVREADKDGSGDED